MRPWESPNYQGIATPVYHRFAMTHGLHNISRYVAPQLDIFASQNRYMALPFDMI